MSEEKICWHREACGESN